MYSVGNKRVFGAVMLLLPMMTLFTCFAQGFPKLPYAMTFVYEILEDDGNVGLLTLDFGWPRYDSINGMYYLEVTRTEEWETPRSWSIQEHTIVDLTNLAPLLYQQQETMESQVYSFCFLFHPEEDRIQICGADQQKREISRTGEELDYLSLLCRLMVAWDSFEELGVLDLFTQGERWFAKGRLQPLVLSGETVWALPFYLTGEQGLETIWLDEKTLWPLQFQLGAPWRGYTARLVSMGEKLLHYSGVLEWKMQEELQGPVGRWR